MKGLVNWLNTPPKNVFWLVLKAAALYSVYGSIVTILFRIVEITTGVTLNPSRMYSGEMNDGDKTRFLAFIFVIAPLSSTAEELLCRAPWLSITGKLRPRSGATVVVAIITSIIFGWIHEGVATIPVQGVMGIILSFSYLKCGGQDGKFWKPLFVAIAIHTLANWVIVAINGMILILTMVTG